MKPNSINKITKVFMLRNNIKTYIAYFVSFFYFFKTLSCFLKANVLNQTSYFVFRNYKCTALLGLILNFSFLISKAQTFPVQINTQLVPPYSGYLPDYADPNAQQLKVFLQFNDFSVSQYNLKLKFEIKGNGFSLVTKALYNPPPISLQPGQPILLSGADLAPYLSSNNLDFVGFNQSQYEQRMALPEGYYGICVTAYDYYSGSPVQVSNEACAQGWFTLSNPPLLNLPLCNAVINPLDPQNIIFSWTPVNLGSPNSAFNTNYLFELWEMRPDSSVNPNQLIQNTQPIFSQITTINNLNYGITEPPLNLYYKYAWRVKAIDASGKDWFINNGYSQVCTFNYGSLNNTLGNSANINLQAEATDYVTGQATWTLQSIYTNYVLEVRKQTEQSWTTYSTSINNQLLQNLDPNTTYECRIKGYGNNISSNYSNPVQFTTPNVPGITNLQAEALDYTSGKAYWVPQPLFTTYQLEVRKVNTQNWFPYSTSTPSVLIDNLEPNKTYQCRVKGFGDGVTSDYSNLANFTTPGTPTYNCNQAPLIYPPSTNPLPFNKAVTGLMVKSGQFDISIKLISPGTMGAGFYSGSGYAMMFGVLPIPVTFTNVFIDDQQRHQQGIIHAVTKGMKNWLNQFDIEDAEENATYTEGTLDSVYISNNQYCFYTLQNPNPVCNDIEPAKLPIVIRDGEGNQYVINGTPPTVSGPTSYLEISNDNLAATDNLKVQFEASTTQNFGFDGKQYAAFTEQYECIKLNNGVNYFVANKSIGANQNDKVIATFTIQNFNASLLIFKTKGGGTLSKSNIGTNKFEITNIPATANCIYAWYNNQKIGKLNVVNLIKVSKKVVLVPVNGASATNITQQNINAIYKQANANFTLTTAPNFTFDLGNDGLEEADAKLFNKYSPEMRALRDAYKQKDSLYDKNAYYVFVVPSFNNPQQLGYMVRGRAVGFIKAGSTATTLAHELAHGVFGLEHTFPKIEQSTSNNLMDYAGGGHLVKGQWLNIQNPTNEFTWWDEEEDGSISVICNDVTTNLVFGVIQTKLNDANAGCDRYTNTSISCNSRLLLMDYLNDACSKSLANLYVKQRIQILEHARHSKFTIGNCLKCSSVIVRIINSTPSNKADSLFTEIGKNNFVLLKDLFEGAYDNVFTEGGNYTNIVKALIDKFVQTNLYQQKLQNLATNIDNDCRNLILGGGNNDHIITNGGNFQSNGYVTYALKEGSPNTCWWESFFLGSDPTGLSAANAGNTQNCFSYSTISGPPCALNPYDLVLITNSSNIDALYNNQVIKNGEVCALPAFFLVYAGDKNFNDALRKRIFTTLDVVTIASSGGALLLTKVNLLRKAWLAFEVTGATLDITLNNSDLPADNKFRKMVEGLNLVQGIVGAKNLAKLSFAKVIKDTKLSAQLQNIRNTVKNQFLSYAYYFRNDLAALNSSQYPKLQSIINARNKLAKAIGLTSAEEQALKTVNPLVNLTRYIASTGEELKNYLNGLGNIPTGKTYNGSMYRSIGKQYNNPIEIHIGAINSNYRYSKPGESGLYLSKTLTGNMTEISHYGDLSNYKTYEYVNVEIDNMLDLTDDLIRQHVGVDFDLLTRTSSNLDEAYEFTHEIGKWAASRGYKGLIVPGARGNKDYVNTIIFKQIDVNNALGNIIPTIINH